MKADFLKTIHFCSVHTGHEQSTDKLENTSLLSVKHLSILISVKVKTIYDWVATDRIPHYKIGSRVLFCPNQINSWLKTLQRGPMVGENQCRETDSEKER